MKEFGEKNWKAIADRVPQRTDSQCLHRWTKVLNPWCVYNEPPSGGVPLETVEAHICAPLPQPFILFLPFLPFHLS